MESTNLMIALEQCLDEIETETTCMTQGEVDVFVESIEIMVKKKKELTEKNQKRAA